MKNTPIRTTRCLAAASLLTVFLLDVLTPATFVIDVLYLCCILLVFRESPRTIIGFTIGACLLIVIHVLIFDLRLKLGLSFWANRVMSIMAIIITSNLVIRFRRLNQAARLKEQHRLEAMEEILFITSHRVRKPVANIIGLTDVINADTYLTIDELKKRCQYLSFSARELDTIIKELNSFIERSEQKNLADSIHKPVSHVFSVPHYAPPSKLEIVV